MVDAKLQHQQQPGLRSTAEQLAGVLERTVEQVLVEKEAALDEKLKYLEAADDDELDRLRQRRLQQLKKQAQSIQQLKDLGHGGYQEIHYDQVPSIVRRSRNVVLHFFRPTTPRCAILDSHYNQLSAKHLKARFLKINAEKAPHLADEYGVYMLPTTVLFVDGKPIHNLIGFEEFGDGTNDDFTTDAVEEALTRHGVITMDAS